MPIIDFIEITIIIPLKMSSFELNFPSFSRRQEEKIRKIEKWGKHSAACRS